MILYLKGYCLSLGSSWERSRKGDFSCKKINKVLNVFFFKTNEVNRHENSFLPVYDTFHSGGPPVNRFDGCPFSPQLYNKK